jgi:hypothetical protein
MIVAVGLLAKAKAGETWLTYACCAYHLDRHRGYNEENHGIGFEHELTPDFRVAAGTFQNSQRRTSNYVGGSYVPLELGPVRIGSAFGFVTGYSKHTIPALAPIVMIEGKEYSLNIVMVPPVQQGRANTSGVLGFQLKYKFRSRRKIPAKDYRGNRARRGRCRARRGRALLETAN